MLVVAALGWVENFITSAERELKDSRRSGMSQSCFFFWDKIGHAKCVGFWFYSAIWRSESRISSRLQVTSISLIYSLTYSASPGFEPTHL